MLCSLLRLLCRKTKVVEMFKMKKTDIAGNLYVHFSVSYISFSEGLPRNFCVN